MKKNTLIIIIFLVVAALIVAGWIIFFSSQEQAPGTGLSPAPVLSQTPQISLSPSPTSFSAQQFEKITDHLVLNPVFASNTVSFFDKTDGFFKNVVPVLDIFKENKASEIVFENVFSVSFSPSRKVALVGFYQGQIIRKFAVFDIQQNLNYLLPDFVKEAVWSVDSVKLLVNHSLPSRGEAYFSTINFDGTKEAKVLDLGLNDVKYFWPNQNLIIFYEKPSPGYPVDKIFSYDLKNKKISLINFSLRESYKSGFYGFDLLPSPDGKAILFSLTDQAGANLRTFLQNLETSQIVELDFKTLVQKCAWTSDSAEIVCAYSDELKNAFSLPFDYWMGKVKSNDSFVKFNLLTGEKKIYAEKTGFDALNFSLSAEKNFLLFTNQADQSLYRMRL